MMPHTPYTPPERLLAKYRDKTPSIHVARYWAMIEWFDETCGALLDVLDREKLAENTVVVYLADNGWVQDPDKGDSVRSKRTPYDAGVRTPILLRWPGKVRPMQSADVTSSLDVVPTLLAAVGAKRPAGLPGVDLLDPQTRGDRTRVYGAAFTHNAVDLNEPAKNVRHRWVTDGHWKLIVPHVAADKDGPGAVELYDVNEDPHETVNLAAKEPGAVKELRAKLDQWWDPRGGGTIPPPAP
jgi:uncharacterized sulfatase